MKEIIKLILKYHFTIIFILLEVVSFSLIVQHNNYQRTVFLGRTASFFGYISSLLSTADDYLLLARTNGKLAEENIRLKNTVEELQSYIAATASDTIRIDTTVFDPAFVYQRAKIVNSNFNKTKNYITLNKGFANGLKKEMAVCSNEGVVGVIQNASNHYAVVLPLINVNSRISAKVKKNGYYGSLQWDGNDYKYSYLNDIPFHVNVQQGDTIVTSGFSSIFPEGELIGFVEAVNKETANFLRIKIRLAVDFKKITDVYIITNKKKEEKLNLEASINE